MVNASIQAQRRLFAQGKFTATLIAAARREVRQRGVWIAAQSMFYLNRAARQVTPEEKERIYELKARMVKRLYETGFCVATVREQQAQKCRPCDGDGVIKRNGRVVGDCDNCGGSGIYRTNILYRFTFDVQGRIYIWHQPEDLVLFEPTFTDDSVARFQKWDPHDDAHVDEMPLHAAIVEAWLAQDAAA